MQHFTGEFQTQPHEFIHVKSVVGELGMGSSKVRVLTLNNKIKLTTAGGNTVAIIMMRLLWVLIMTRKQVRDEETTGGCYDEETGKGIPTKIRRVPNTIYNYLCFRPDFVIILPSGVRHSSVYVHKSCDQSRT